MLMTNQKTLFNEYLPIRDLYLISIGQSEGFANLRQPMPYANSLKAFIFTYSFQETIREFKERFGEESCLFCELDVTDR